MQCLVQTFDTKTVQRFKKSFLYKTPLNPYLSHLSGQIFKGKLYFRIRLIGPIKPFATFLEILLCLHVISASWRRLLLMMLLPLVLN
jgi:hypothetical protein